MGSSIELQSLQLFNEKDIVNYLVKENPDILEYQPTFYECWKMDSSMSYYLSKLTDSCIINWETKCREIVVYDLNIGFPYNDSLSLWVNWLEKGLEAKWISYDENKVKWTPLPPSSIAETVTVVGYQSSEPTSNPNYESATANGFDKICITEYSFVKSGNPNWTHDEETTLKMQMPARITPCMFMTDRWMMELGYYESLVHQFGNSKILLGGIQSLGMENDSLTISGAINRTKQLQALERKIDVLGISVKDSISTKLAPLILILVQFNFFLHCSRLKESINSNLSIESQQYPWIPLYPGLLAKIYYIFTITLAPSFLSALLFYSGFERSNDSFFIIMFTILLFIFSLAIGSASSMNIHDAARRINR